jgi:hypothetical protein
MLKRLAGIRLPASLERRIGKFASYALEHRGMGIVSYNYTPEQRRIFDLVHKIQTETELLTTEDGAQQLFMAVKKSGRVIGDLAEVGVYKGGSAKLICEAMQERGENSSNLYLFDTFEGLKNVREIDRAHMYNGQFESRFEEVSNYLKGYERVFIYKGLFPATGEPIKNRRFSFVNFDVDTYESTAACIQFFYPRMNPGGIIMSHDYATLPGVKKAIDDFFADKPELIIEMARTQCLVVKS